MGTKREPQNEQDSYHTSASPVTNGYETCANGRSRFGSEFGRINATDRGEHLLLEPKGARLMIHTQHMSHLALLLVACGLIVASCAHDTYQERANLIKNHAEAFYDNLKTNRVESAIRNNEQIEAMASEMGATVRKQGSQQGTTAVEREFALMKTANEAAATNWLALGQYFAIKRQYSQARATYQRVIDTYTNPTDRPHREQALRALKDLDMLNPPTTTTTNP